MYNAAHSTEPFTEREKILCDVVQRFAADLVYVIDRSGRIVEANDRFWSELGLTRESTEQAVLCELLNADDRAMAMRSWATILSHRNSVRSVRKLQCGRGESKTYSILESPILNANECSHLVGIARDITEESALDEKLWAAHENRTAALEYAVRASLGLVKGYVFSLHKLESMPVGKREQFTRVILEEVDSMGRSIENLLLSRGLGSNNEEAAAFDIREIITEAVTSCKAECERRRIEVKFESGHQEINLYGQPVASMRILSNVLDFMILRLTHAGEISITTADFDEYIEIKVSDNGVQVPNDLLKWLGGGPFSSARQDIVCASGITDLEVARLMAESLGGGIVTAAGETCGLTFTIMLPRVPYSLSSCDSKIAEQPF